ncbi:MAG: four helix bundle protein [Bacteroidaceae bacterium]|nr:four helix bundle protein [Bacteroidaceae bacterium]MBP3830737.1 four helix bundle protein [Bacteroidaceae bacterium]
MQQITNRGNDSPLNVKSKSFAVRIVKMVKHLGKDWSISALFQQILRSATSVHANIRESEFAQSPSDFISKLSIALKEANETQGWLEILFESECVSEKAFESLYTDCDELISMLSASIKTAKRNNGLL